MEETPSKLEAYLRESTEDIYGHRALREAHAQAMQILRTTELPPDGAASHVYFDRMVTSLTPLRWSCFESKLEVFPLLMTERLDGLKWKEASPSKDPWQAILHVALSRYFNEVRISGLSSLPYYAQPSSDGADGVSFLRVPIKIHDIQLGQTVPEWKIVSYLRFYRNAWPHVASQAGKAIPI